MYNGEWTGTMCLTEPQAGSDVGASKTRGRQATRRHATCISGREDLHHLGRPRPHREHHPPRCSRAPRRAPEGTKGLSLFIVPKIRVNPDGSLGEPNDVVLRQHRGEDGHPRLPHLLAGLRRQRRLPRPSCSARSSEGMKLMFHMMNAARIEVGLQGCGRRGRRLPGGARLRQERLQSRHWTKSGTPTAPQVPIVEHPDVRRMLLHLQGLRPRRCAPCSCRPPSTST